MLAARGARHPAAYSIAIVMAGMVTSMVVAVGISIQASNRAIRRAQEAEQRTRQEQAATDEANRVATCRFIKTISDAYKEDPPPSKTGKNVAEAWATLAALCD